MRDTENMDVFGGYPDGRVPDLDDLPTYRGVRIPHPDGPEYFRWDGWDDTSPWLWYEGVDAALASVPGAAPKEQEPCPVREDDLANGVHHWIHGNRIVSCPEWVPDWVAAVRAEQVRHAQ